MAGWRKPSLTFAQWDSGLAKWHAPSAGMFLWLELTGVRDTRRLIVEKALEKEVCRHRRRAVELASVLTPCPAFVVVVVVFLL